MCILGLKKENNNYFSKLQPSVPRQNLLADLN